MSDHDANDGLRDLVPDREDIPHCPIEPLRTAADAGERINLVPYNQGGTMAAIADIMGGRVHATIEGVFGMRGPLQSGDLKLIGAMSPERDPA